MNIHHFQRTCLISGVALLVNLFLFGLLPNFMKPQIRQNDLESVVPVNLVRIKPHQPPAERKKEEPPISKEKPRVPPKVREPMPQTRMRNMKMDVDMPKLSFDINPALTGGVAVAPPPEKPQVVKAAAPLKMKDFYAQEEVDEIPVPIVKNKPVYPYRARRLRLSGAVEVRFLVNAEGFVRDVRILESNPPDIFDDSVLKVLPTWRFKPGKFRGKAVDTLVVATIEFKLEG